MTDKQEIERLRDENERLRETLRFARAYIQDDVDLETFRRTEGPARRLRKLIDEALKEPTT